MTADLIIVVGFIYLHVAHCFSHGCDPGFNFKFCMSDFTKSCRMFVALLNTVNNFAVLNVSNIGSCVRMC